MRAVRAGVLALALLAAPGATAATLRSSDVLLQDQQVRLSDLFDGVVRDQAIGPSPDPGGRIVVEQAQLAAIARQFGVDWRPASTADRVVLQRPGRLYPREPVMAALREALLNAGVPATAEIETPALNPPMVPPDESARPEVTQAFYDSVTGRFTALLSITATNMAPFNARLSGHVQEMVEVEVATRRIAAGDIIGGGDVQVARLRAGLVRAEAARVPEQVVGMAMRHPLSAGAPILLADLGRPDLVQRGSPVEVKLNMPGLSVTVQGVAMEPGGAGDRVHVLNPNSRAVMEAEVTGPLQVRMSGGANPVLLAPGAAVPRPSSVRLAVR